MNENKVTTTCNKYGGMISKLYNKRSFYGPLAITNSSSEVRIFRPGVLRYASSFGSGSHSTVNVFLAKKLVFLTGMDSYNGIYKDAPFFSVMLNTNMLLLQIRYDIA